MYATWEVETMEQKWKESSVDVVNLILAAFLFLTPWIFGFVSDHAAAPNAWVSGIVIGVVAILSAHKIRRVGGMDQSRARPVGSGVALGAEFRGSEFSEMGSRLRGTYCRCAGQSPPSVSAQR
jgi:SPW repeat